MMKISKTFKTLQEYEDFKKSDDALREDMFSYIICKVIENNKFYILQSTPLAIDDGLIQYALFRVFQDLNEELYFTDCDSDFADIVEDMSNEVYSFLEKTYGIVIDQVTTDF